MAKGGNGSNGGKGGKGGGRGGNKGSGKMNQAKKVYHIQNRSQSKPAAANTSSGLSPLQQNFLL
jgi:hypothetical protein